MSRISLRKFHYAAFASEETSCFSATVLLDGVPCFSASNDGQGGCDHYVPLKGQSRADFDAKLKQVTDYAASLPPVRIYGEDHPMHIELLIGKEVAKKLEQQDLKRLLKKNLVFTSNDPEKPGIRVTKLKLQPGQSTENLVPAQVAIFKAKLKVKNLLNELPFEKAFEIYHAELAARELKEQEEYVKLHPKKPMEQPVVSPDAAQEHQGSTTRSVSI